MLEYLFSYGAMKSLSQGGMAGGSSSIGMGIGLQQMMGVIYSDDILFNPAGDTIQDARQTLEQRRYRAQHFGLDIEGRYAANKSMISNALGGTVAGGTVNRQKAPTMGGALSLVGPATSLYFIYDGWSQNGFKGAFDALVYDIAVSTAGGIYGHQQVLAQQVTKEGGKFVEKFGTKVTMPFGAMGYMGIALGSSIGFEMGKEHLGLPGGVMGAFAGGKLMQMGLRGGMSTVAALGIAAGVKGIDYGVSLMKDQYNERQRLLDVGAAYRRSRRGVDTANNMASFYTMNSNTMRSRAVMAMRNSHMNARSALGMEATFMHSGRDYFSSYR